MAVTPYISRCQRKVRDVRLMFGKRDNPITPLLTIQYHKTVIRHEMESFLSLLWSIVIPTKPKRRSPLKVRVLVACSRLTFYLG